MWAVNLHRLGFKIVGLWPSNKYTKKSLWPEIWIGIVFILMIFVCNIPMICAIIEVWGNFIFVIDNLHTTLPQLMISIKYIIIRRKQTVLLSIVSMMAEDWMTFKLEGERDVMIKRAQTARLLMMIGYILVVMSVLTLIILPYYGIQVMYVANITDVRKLLPLKTYHFYNTDESPQFELTFFIHTLTALLGGTIYVCVDFFLVLTVLHICGQLENFRCRLINLISCKNFNKVLNNIVATHLRLIRFADNIENTYSLMMLISVLHFCIAFCLSGFLFTIVNFVWAVELHRLGLKLIGLWPSTDEISKKKLGSNICVGFIFTVIFVSGVPLVWALIRVWGDMVLMIDNLRITLPLIVVLFKFIIIRWKRKVLLSIINMMAEDWISLKLNTERDVMIKRARSARLLIIFGFVLMSFAFIMLIIFPCFDIQIRHITNLTDRKKPLPLQTYYFYDTDKSPQFELTFLVQAVTISLAGIIYTSVDAFLGLVIFHICGQLENFRRRLVKLILCKNFNRALNNSIVYHLRLIRFADNIEKTFSLMMLGLVIYFGIVFCLCGFLLVSVVTDQNINHANVAQACYMAIAALILLTHTFLYCGAGELIIGQLLKTSAGYISFLLAKGNFVWAIELNRFGLELIGLWPKTNEVVKDKYYTSDLRVVIIFIIITFISGIPLVCSLVRVRRNMLLVTDNLQITLPLMIVSLKLVIMRWKRSALLPIIKMMAEDWVTLKLDTERNVMMKRARTARLIVICGYVLMILAFTVIIIFPCFGVPFRRLTNLTDRDKPLPLQTYYFYDTDKSPQFELTLVIQAITIFLAAVTYTSVDAFLGLTILHICGQLENYRSRLVNLVSCKDFNNALRSNVIAHLRLIRFASKIEDTFTLMMLGLVFYFGIVFCLYGFLLLTVVTDDETSGIPFSQILYAIVGITSLLTHTFLYCGAGELITEQCEAIYRTLNDLEWYKLESKKARCLILLMTRASEPFRFTAGKIIPLTMTTFCSLLKTSASYISFLLANRG
ncbi:OR13A protein, partial [Acromyrmex insinuator]